MGIFSLISTALTGVGYALLAYKTSFILSQNPQAKNSLLQPLGMKWIVFLLFLMIEPTLQAIFDIIPFGSLALLAVKCMIVLPQNTLATYIYKRIERQLQKMQFDQYNTKLGIYSSKACKFVTIKCIKAAKMLAVYVKRGQLEQIYLGIQDTLKALQYKRMTVEANKQLVKSKLQRQMSTSSNLDESRDSIDEKDLNNQPQIKQSDMRQSEVINRMSMIYLKPAQNQGSEYKVIADIMTVKPNKQQGIKAKYELGTVIFNSATKDISFSYQNGKSIKDKLNQIKYVKLNMTVIELILQNQPSIVIKFLQEQDVFPWVKPVMNILNGTH